MGIDGYAIDIASYQAGLDLSKVKSEGYKAVFVKATQGVGYVNPYYAGWKAQAASIGLPFVPYHYITTDNAASQVQWFRANAGAGVSMVMLDVEAGSGNAVQIATVVKAFAAAYSKVMLYMPEWFWEELGSPSMTGWGVDLLTSSGYPTSGGGDASTVYAKSGTSGWGSYGGITPLIWQFTDNVTTAGQSHIDADALAVGVLNQLGGGTVTAPPAPPTVPVVTNPATHNTFTPLAVDGNYGPQSVKATQLIVYAGVLANCDGSYGPDTRKHLQSYLGVTADGDMGPVSVKALQKRVGAAQDGQWGHNTTVALQGALNSGKF